MDSVLSVKDVTAAKDHYCDSCRLWLESGLHLRDCNNEQKEAIELAKADGFKILKGQKYIKVTVKYDGVLQTFKHRPDMYKVCDELELFEEF